MSARKTQLALLAAGCVLLLAMYTAAGSGGAVGSARPDPAARVPDSFLI